MLRWAIAANCCPWDAEIITAIAAGSKQWAVLSWLAEEGRLAGFMVTFQAVSCKSEALLNWAMKHGCPWHEAFTGRYIASGGRDLGSPGALITAPADEASLAWAVARGCRWHPDISLLCITSRPHLLKFVIRHGCPWHPESSIALAVSNLACASTLEWAISAGCPWHPDTSLALAVREVMRLGDTALMEWAVRNGCPWHPETSVRAAQCATPDMLRWALANGCPLHEDTVRELARHGREQWLDDI